MKTVDQKRIKKIILQLIDEKEIIGFEMVELPDGERSVTFFYTDKEDKYPIRVNGFVPPYTEDELRSTTLHTLEKFGIKARFIKDGEEMKQLDDETLLIALPKEIQ
jgi:hypothetical protein